MGETLGALTAELLRRGLDGLEPARATRCVNIGARRVCRHSSWPFLLYQRTVVQGEAIPDLYRVREVYLTDNVALGNLPYLHRAPSVPAVGNAAAWYFDGATAISPTAPRGTAIYLHPGQVAGITVVYYRTHPWMDDDADECLVPDAYSSVVLDAAAIEASKDLREWESVAGFKAELADGLAEMVDELIDQQAVGWEIIEPAVY